MWIAGIVYIVLGNLMIRLANITALQLPPTTVRLYRIMRTCGIVVLLLYPISFLFPEPYSTIIPILPIFFFCWWVFKWMDTLLLFKKEKQED